MTDTERFRATTLREVVESQGRKASWVAERAKISRFLMSHIMSGRRTVTRDTGEAIADAINVPFFVLFELSKDTITSPEEAVA